MKLAAVVDALESVPEAARGFYVADGDKFVLDADVESHPALSNLKSAHQRQKELNATIKSQLKQFEGVDLEEYAALKEAGGKGGKGGKGGAGGKGEDEQVDIEKVVEKRMSAKMAEVQPILDEVETLRGENRRLKLHGAVSKAALEAGVLPDALDDALSASDRYFDLKDGKIVVHDDDGDPTGLTPDKFFTDYFKKKKPWFYSAKSGSGGGTTPTKGSGGAGPSGMSVDDIMKLPAAERMALGRAGQK